MQVVTGLVSHNLCSLVFVSGVDAQAAYRESLAPRPGMSLVNWAVGYDVDSRNHRVETTLAGAFDSAATTGSSSLSSAAAHDA